MTNHENRNNTQINERLRQILLTAEGRYGEGAQFARETQQGIRIMPLEHALQYCAERIATEPDEKLWPMLDTMWAQAMGILRKMGERAVD